MRLDDFDNDIRVEDQRGGNFGGSGGGGLGSLVFGLLPLLLGRKLGCGTIAIILVVGFFLFSSGTLNLGDISGEPDSRTRQAGTDTASICAVDAGSKEACDTLSSLDETWAQLLQGYQRPKLVFYGNRGQSGCGAAQSAMGPFYCPTDEGIYLDTAFFKELENRFGAAGDFAQRYVIAHEMGHHIQNITGTMEKVRAAQSRMNRAQGNAMSVRVELQADCYAGVWAARNKNRLEAGDIEEGMRAANAIGDDTLQRQAQGTVVPESFTHGTSAQRMAWLRRGLETGDPAQCDTFQGAI